MNLRVLPAAVSLLLCPLARPADPPSPDTRIALRYGFGDVLIVGGECTGDPKGLSQMVYSVPLMPARRIYVETPESLERKGRSVPRPKTDWKVGDRWQVYSGGGAPVTVEIQKLVLFQYSRKFHDGAITHIVDKEDANRVAAMLATAYLAAPGDGLTGVSQTPLLPEYNNGLDQGRISPVLLRVARKIVQDENWKTEGTDKDTDFFKKIIVEMNAGLLADSFDSRFPRELRILRWPLPGQEPLLFVQAMWSRDEGPPLFAVDAVMERNSLKIVSFDTQAAESVRTIEALTPNCTVGSVKCRGNTYPTSLDDTSRFLNAWKIGDRYFVLTFARELVGFSLMLHELGMQNGLVQTGLGFRVNEN